MNYPTYNKSKTLKEMQREGREYSEAHGWFDIPRTFGDDIALLHSEVSEALDAFRQWGTDDQTPEGCKPEGVGSELADVLIRLLDTCERHGIDLEAEYERKYAFNLTRPYRHGNKRL